MMRPASLALAFAALLAAAPGSTAGSGAARARTSGRPALQGQAPGAPPPQETPEAAESATPAPDDPTRTAGGALAAFMSLRHYGTIRQLKALMTPALQARFDHDSAPFNGKRTIRLSAFEFSEKDLKPVGARGTRPAAQAAAGAGVPEAYIATVKALWEDQGEAVELRTEAVRISRNEEGLWRIAGLDRVDSDALRFRDAVPGVTALRLLLRAWARRDAASARSYMSPAFLKRYTGREEALQALIAGADEPRHTAFQIMEMQPQGTSEATAKVKFFETTAGRPSSLEGSVHVLRMARKGVPWLLDAWE